MSATPRILVIDDHPINTDMVRFVLEPAGMQVDVASGAAQGLERIKQARPDLVLMDVQMPEVDGLTLTRQLRADPATQDLVIVAFTAFAGPGDEYSILQAGCDGYIAKPIDVNSFTARIREFLARSPGTRYTAT